MSRRWRAFFAAVVALLGGGQAAPIEPRLSGAMSASGPATSFPAPRVDGPRSWAVLVSG